MLTSHLRGAVDMLFQTHGLASATIAAERAEERFANIDVGGYAYWKNVESSIRNLLSRGARPV